MYKVAKLMHQYTQKKLPNKFSHHFTPGRTVHTRTTRLASSGLNLYLSRYRFQKLQKSLKYQGAKSWNSAPSELKKLQFNSFKIKYKQHLLLKYM